VRVVVVTVARGRHDHLKGQLAGLGRSRVAPSAHVVVAVDDSELDSVAVSAHVPTAVTHLKTQRTQLPIASARNLGAREGIHNGADLLVFLDVDCIPGPRLVDRYLSAARRYPRALLSGPVAYLDPPPPDGYDLDAMSQTPGHPARPVPPEDGLEPDGDHRLFWSLSFAVTTAAWRELGGFCEQYSGYGGEDTDLGQIAFSRGIKHVWVGGAWAYHQYHPVTDPPVDHAPDIVRNANLFHERWGWWPMAGWLEAFAERGLAHKSAGRWVHHRASA
jgi:N-acetylglucosaminyl-diphospho-decaprenol L-rhamnosyltransferase